MKSKKNINVMKSIWLVLIIIIFCASIFAQKNSPDATQDSLEREILKVLNETEWDYFYPPPLGQEGMRYLQDEVKIENKSLTLNFEELGIKTVSLVNKPISHHYINTTIRIGSGEGQLGIHHPVKHYDEDFSVKERTQAQEETLRLFNLLKTYHFKHFIDSLDTKIEEFQIQVQKYQENSEKTVITEDQRKFIVQANAENEAKNYPDALSLYKKAIKINQFAYPSAYYNMALIAAQLSDYGYAIFNMKKYLILEPNAPDARAAQDKIYEWELNIN